MSKPQRQLNSPSLPPQPEGETAYLNALPMALVALDNRFHITFLNDTAEMLLGAGNAQAIGQSLFEILPFLESRLPLMQRAFTASEAVSLHEDKLAVAHDIVKATLHFTPVITHPDEPPQEALLSIIKAEGLPTLAASQWKQEATRAAGLMAAMLAHEVKNPLSGIRGAAQILKDETASEHQPLAELICRESDRIRDLLAQMEIFTDEAPLELEPVNIHEVLQYVISVARSGFAPTLRIEEKYDPSLPEALARRELLVPLFLNLVKNAAEAMENRPESTLTLTTGYKSGYRLARPLPLMISIEDTGSGIPDALRDKLFEPFCTSKGEGRGLGLAVVAKIAADLGAVVELDPEYRDGTRFNVMLPCTP